MNPARGTINQLNKMGIENTMNNLDVHVRPGDAIINRYNHTQAWKVEKGDGQMRRILKFVPTPIEQLGKGFTTYRVGPGDWIHNEADDHQNWMVMSDKDNGISFEPYFNVEKSNKMSNKETNKITNGEATVCTRKIERFRTEWPNLPHPENDEDCDNLCGVEDLHSTITADVCLDLALSCENPAYVHKAEGNWVRYILESCKAAAMECGHLSYNFGLRGKIDWNTVGQLIEERGFEVTFFDKEHDNRYRPGCLGGIPGSVDSMNVYWGRRNKNRPSTT